MISLSFIVWIATRTTFGYTTTTEIPKSIPTEIPTEIPKSIPTSIPTTVSQVSQELKRTGIVAATSSMILASAGDGMAGDGTTKRS